MQYLPCYNALLALETLFLTKKSIFLPKVLRKVQKSRQIFVFDFDKIAYVRVWNFRPSPNFLAKALRTFAQLLPPCQEVAWYLKWKLYQAEFKLGFIAQSCLAPGFRWGVHFLVNVIDEKPRACLFAARWCQTCLQWGQIFPVLRWNSGRMNICRWDHH